MTRFRIGDKVCRVHDDVWVIVALPEDYDPAGDLADCVCEKAPADGWAQVGEKQSFIIEDLESVTETLLPEPQPDRFEHESPIRAFTDWNVTGSYAIGKGFRPSVAHLPTYLDAMERKEGWQLVQILYADDHERRSLVFHRMIPPVVKLDFPMVTDKEQAKRLADHFRDTFPRFSRLWEPDRLDNVEFPAADEGVPIPVVGDIAEPDEDDPVNPKHYDGTECAQIGEKLSANCYQVLKYVWRLGEKDDPCVEIGKALWYLEREMALGLPASRSYAIRKKPMEKETVERLCAKRKPLVTQVALGLYAMCYRMGTAPQFQQDAEHVQKLLLDAKQAAVNDGLCTTGLAL